MKFVPSHFHDFADIFSKTSALQLPPSGPFDHAIELKDGATPGYGPIYSISEPERAALKEFIDDHLATGTIHSSQSPIGAPVLLVKKKDRSLRMVVDYQRLNTATWKDQYLLPRINDLLERLGKVSIFTKIDLRNAYHLLCIKDRDEWKTAFRTRYGSFEFLIMPFGLTNATSSFQRFMNTIFGDLLDVTLVVYLDDLLIFLPRMRSTETMSAKSYAGCGNMASMPSPRSVSGNATQWSSLGTIVPWRVYRWTRARSK